MIQPLISSAESSLEAWDRLSQSYANFSRSRIISLKAKLASTPKGNKSIAEFLNEMRSIAYELALTQNPISEEDLVVHIITQLGDEYNSIVAAIKVHESPITYAELFEKLTDFERMIKEKDSASLPVIPTINATHRQNSKAPQFQKSFQAYNSNDQKSRGGYGDRSYRPWQSQNGIRSYLADLSCQFCEITGHATSDCRKLASGASHHATSNLSALQTYAYYGGPDEILLGDGEYQKLIPFFSSCGISHLTSPPHTPEHNGTAERRHQHIVETGLSLLHFSSLPFHYWSHVFQAAVYLINRLPSSVLSFKSPFEMLFHKIPNYSGGSSQANDQHNPSTHDSPIFPPSSRVPSPTQQPFPSSNSQPAQTPIMESLSPSPSQNQTPHIFEIEPSSTFPQTISTPQPPSTCPQTEDATFEQQIITTPVISPSPTPQTNSSSPSHIQLPIERPARQRKQNPKYFSDKYINIITKHPLPPTLEPTTVNQAVKEPLWRQAMDDEYNFLLQNRTWELVPTSSHVPIGYKWIFRIKRKPDGSIDKYKARLVAKAFFKNLDVITLRHSALSFGFRKSLADASLFIYNQDGVTVYFLVYVDDIILTGNNSKFMDDFVNKLATRFSIKDLGSLHQFLGVEVISTTSGLFLSQHRHTADLLSRFKMIGVKEVATPLNSTETLSLTDGSPNVDVSSYRSIVGSLQYLAITRPDVSFAVNKLSQFMHAPTHLHLQALKRVLRYLKGTIHHGLFLKRASPFTLTAFYDSDWGGVRDNRRSTTAY
ncbi:retrovirus-related pol polyprotein from transposon RE1 [Tanacetum coccineum]